VRSGTAPQLEVVPAATPELRHLSYRLRYDIYCVEHSFLNAADYPDRLETDEFDVHSLHALLLHTPSNRFIGTVRLIMPKSGARKPAMPFASLCRDPRYRAGDALPAASTAEISRFAISKSFRAAIDNQGHEGASTAPDRAARRLMPHLSLGLILAITQMALANGVTHVCAVMEPALLRLLHRLGIEFKALGPAVDYHGMRQPCYARVLELLEQLRVANPENWAVVTDGGRFLSRESISRQHAAAMALA
jgi:N-acyl amino acid synthase of PEP-CTERM/exosortase system